MITSTYNNGFRVENITPQQGADNVSINSDITIQFNSELKVSSIPGGFTVLEDEHNIYNSNINLNNQISSLKSITGNVRYLDRSIIFTPSSELKKGIRYLICIKANGITDILGNTTLKEEVFTFFTVGTSTEPKIEILHPINNSILTSLNNITLTETNEKLYFIQISKISTFEVLIEDTVCNYNTNNIELKYNLADGLYFLRAKTPNGEWSEVIQFFIKSQEDGLVSSDDINNFLNELNEEEIELLEVYPPLSSDMISLKLGVIYFKFSGFVSLEDVDFSNTYIYNEYINEDDIDEFSLAEIKGSWNSIYDNDSNVSYILFNLE